MRPEEINEATRLGRELMPFLPRDDEFAKAGGVYLYRKPDPSAKYQVATPPKRMLKRSVLGPMMLEVLGKLWSCEPAF